MIHWLQKYSGTDTGCENVEKIELERLRKEIKHYKKKYEKEDEEMKVLSGNKEKEQKEEQEKIDKEIKQKKMKKKHRKQTIYDEVLEEKAFKELIYFNPHKESKSSEIAQKLVEKCKTLFLFDNLSEIEMSLIINAFRKEEFKEGDKLFSQGDKSKKLYIVDSGELNCWKIFKPGDPETYIKSYKEGDSFGELALLYDYNRNYTIKAKTKSVVYSMDKKDYKGIILGEEIKKREKIKNVLKNVEILQTLTPNEFNKLCDITFEQNFQAGDEILKQNENDDLFMILNEGNCHSEKASESNKGPQILKEFKKYDYFGDIPWFKCEQRNYSVKADSECNILIISRIEFKRLIDSLENILKRDIYIYQKFMKK
jgi:cAMP-dependent protein kinase regulator